jgi:hypothetical protein
MYISPSSTILACTSAHAFGLHRDMLYLREWTNLFYQPSAVLLSRRKKKSPNHTSVCFKCNHSSIAGAVTQPHIGGRQLQLNHSLAHAKFNRQATCLKQFLSLLLQNCTWPWTSSPSPFQCVHSWNLLAPHSLSSRPACTHIPLHPLSTVSLVAASWPWSGLPSEADGKENLTMFSPSRF